MARFFSADPAHLAALWDSRGVDEQLLSSRKKFKAPGTALMAGKKPTALSNKLMP